MLLGGLVTGPRIDEDCDVLHIDTTQSASIHGAYDCVDTLLQVCEEFGYASHSGVPHNKGLIQQGRKV